MRRAAVGVTLARLGLPALPLAALTAPARADLTADQTPFPAYRGLWLDRFDFSVSNTNTIATAMANAKALGFTDVMFQVRGQGDAYYYNTGGLEPRVSGVTASNDPLQVAINQAHARGLKLHAYINTMPLWNAQQTGTSVTNYSPAAPAAHIINTHPEWWIRNASDQPLPFPSGSAGYVIVNPARPDVRQHVTAVAGTIASNYAVDGVHLDYIRLYNSNPGATNVLEYPADPYTISLFQQQYPGKTNVSDPALFKGWMADNITALVKSVRETVKAVRPGAQLTASVWRDADIGLDEYQQDWARWIDPAASGGQNLLDAAMPMIYRKGFGSGTGGTNVDSGDLYRLNVTEALDRRGVAGVMPGLGTYMQNDPATAYANTIAQLSFARDRGANGVQVFDYGTLYNSTGTLGQAQAEVRRALGDFFASNSAAAAAAVTDFEADEGYFGFSPTQAGQTAGIAAATADRVTTEARTGIAAQRITVTRSTAAASFTLRHLSGSNGTPANLAADPSANTPYASIGTVGLWVKTTTRDLQVSIGLDDAQDLASPTNRTTGDRGFFKNVIPDGQWHKYEWPLSDPGVWDAWTAGGNGHLSSIVSLDSVFFVGTAAANTFYIDDVFYDPGAVAADQWSNDADGAWSNASFWTGGVPNGTNAAANLLRRTTAPRVLTLDKPVTLGTLTIDSAAGYTIAGTNALALDTGSASSTASVRVVNRGAHAIAAPLTIRSDASLFVDRGSTLVLSGALSNAPGRSLAKTGDGVLEVAGPQAHGAGASLAASAGTLRLLSNGGTNLAVVASGEGRVELGAAQALKSLSLQDGATAALAPGGKTLAVTALAVTATARLDLSDGALAVDYAPGASPLSGVRSLILSGRAGGAWDGPGIMTSAATATANLALGYAEAAAALGLSGTQTASFLGMSVDATTVLVRATLAGDADLDGAVGFADLLAVAQNYGRATGAVWSDGDLTYDGAVEFADLLLVAQNYDLSAGAPGAVPGAPAGFDAEWQAALARVPEPALAWAGAAALAFGRRRRR